VDLQQAALLLSAAVLAGAINAVAGGGSFISFPALLFAGIAPISANATNTAALWPGNAASVGAYRRELMQQRGSILVFGIVSVVGGIVGALLLLKASDALFERLIPYLMLLATVVFTLSPRIQRMARTSSEHASVSPGRRILLMAIYLAVAIYGGFFGAGLGILTLAVLALLGQSNIHEMNALKTLQATLINGVALVTFIAAGVIAWPQALVMAVGAIIGGYGGAAIARQVPAIWVRRLVVVISVTLTIYFFLK
jgi:uncharacterized membrane protein YfcA